jgi:hypothetical protein
LAVPAAAAVGGAAAGGTITGAISAGVGHIVAAGEHLSLFISTVLLSNYPQAAPPLILCSLLEVVVLEVPSLQVAARYSRLVIPSQLDLELLMLLLKGSSPPMQEPPPKFVSTTSFHSTLTSILIVYLLAAATFLPKAIEIVENEVGGFNNVQKEVIQILSSPNIAKDVREEGLSILSRLGAAIAADRLAEEEEQKKREKDTKEIQDSTPSTSNGTSEVKPGLKRVQTSVSALMNKLERKAARRAATEPCLDLTLPDEDTKDKKPTRSKTLKDTTNLPSTPAPSDKKAQKAAKQAAKDAKSWSMLDFDAHEAYSEGAGEARMLSTKESLRIHGLFMNDRRHFEIHEREGKLVLIDANTKETVKVG